MMEFSKQFLLHEIGINHKNEEKEVTNKQRC